MSILHILSVYSSQDLIQISIPKLVLQLGKLSVLGHSTLLIFNFFFFYSPSHLPKNMIIITTNKASFSRRQRHHQREEKYFYIHKVNFFLLWLNEDSLQQKKWGPKKLSIFNWKKIMCMGTLITNMAVLYIKTWSLPFAMTNYVNGWGACNFTHQVGLKKNEWPIMRSLCT